MTLDEIAIKHGCDKSSLHHDYCRIYERYFSDYEYINLFEVGYGGYDDPMAGGESANMWVEWGCNVIVIDIHKKDNVNEGVTFEQCSSGSIMAYRFAQGSNVIIDDGSHLNADIIATFKNLWPALAPGGLYCVEDVHSSYSGYYQDSDPRPGARGTAMGFFSRLLHSVNADFIEEQYKDEMFLHDDIEYIHFYKDLVIIKKKT